MTFVSYPVVYEDIILGIEWGMALSTVATALAFIVLAVMLRNIRQLALVLANILCAIGTTLSIMCALPAFVFVVLLCFVFCSATFDSWRSCSRTFSAQSEPRFSSCAPHFSIVLFGVAPASNCIISRPIVYLMRKLSSAPPL